MVMTLVPMWAVYCPSDWQLSWLPLDRWDGRHLWWSAYGGSLLDETETEAADVVDCDWNMLIPLKRRRKAWPRTHTCYGYTAKDGIADWATRVEIRTKTETVARIWYSADYLHPKTRGRMLEWVKETARRYERGEETESVPTWYDPRFKFEHLPTHLVDPGGR